VERKIDFFLKFGEQSRGRIRRTIVDDDELEVAESLHREQIERPAEDVGALECRNDDGDFHPEILTQISV